MMKIAGGRAVLRRHWLSALSAHHAAVADCFSASGMMNKQGSEQSARTTHCGNARRAALAAKQRQPETSSAAGRWLARGSSRWSGMEVAGGRGGARTALMNG